MLLRLGHSKVKNRQKSEIKTLQRRRGSSKSVSGQGGPKISQTSGLGTPRRDEDDSVTGKGTTGEGSSASDRNGHLGEAARGAGLGATGR